MTIFFSRSEQTFYDDEINLVLPDDAEEISAAEHAGIFAGVAVGKAIDYSGLRPMLVDVPPPTAEQYRETAFAQRDKALSVAALRIAPLEDAVELGKATEETRASLIKWKQYRISLNEIEHQAGFPEEIQWPLAPDEAPVE
ncbi:MULTISPECIES: tail fiber assembly protein [unclassified Pseudomonas]|uniref:tail fiber assembly protein n=1 Tax=unclassified Pseudomonas TaxID=196821 RepID=UPI002097BC36|nr:MULTISPECIES: tail fiber assembly protein [unclassified Pseudomonas]MCO7519182.1 tail fiber assembly protein [Pseudomonas sp. 1]MCO7540136.1 tail fiber assembly protein [Pseudomonas sp. VA159-2]